MSNCIKCDKTLKRDEIGLFKKLVDKNAQQYLCIECMAKHFDVSLSDLEEKIKQYKQLGCMLFC